MAAMRIAMIGFRGLAEGLGGVEAVIRATAPRLVRAGAEVTCYTRQAYTDSHWLEGVRCRPLPTLHTKHAETACYAALSMLDALGRGYDIVHMHALGSCLFGPIVRWPGRCKVVATVHGLDYQRDKWSAPARAALRLGEAAAARAAHATVCVSEELAGHMRRRYPGAKIIHIPNGCEGSEELPAPPVDWPEGKYLLYLGRLTPEKGVDRLIRAYRHVRSDWPLVIAGPALHAEAYLARCRELAEGDSRIRFAGPVVGQTKRRWLAHAGAFVLPSNLEGQPVALLDAAAFGTPCVASDLPAIREVFAPAHAAPAGLVPPGDVDALQQAIQRLQADPHDARQHARRMRKAIVEHFNWDRISQRLLCLYQSLLRDQPGEIGHQGFPESAD